MRLILLSLDAGWSLDCLQEWGPFVRLAIPSMLMLCLEWWLFEVGAFLAGQISEAELGAQSVAYELVVVAYMVTPRTRHRSLLPRQNDEPLSPQIPMGLSAAASVRVGNALGAGKPQHAKLACQVPVACTCKTPHVTR